MTSRQKILIVEDNSITSFHLKRLMEATGYEVDLLKRAEDIHPLLQENSYVLLILDIMLSGKMTGVDAAEIIREYTKVPIIFLSALTDKVTKGRLDKIPNAVHESKPFNEDPLIEMVKRLVSASN